MYPGTNHRAMYEPFDRLKFSMAAPYDHQVRVGVRYMVETRGTKKVAILFQDDEFGREVRQAAEAEAQALGIPVVAVTSYKRGDTAFSSQVARMRQAGADLIVAGTVVRETAGLGLELKKVGWEVDVLTSAAACTETVPALGGQAVEGFCVQCQYLPFDEESEPEPVKAWLRRYRERFGKPADVSSAIGWDMMELTILALERAGRDLTVDRFVAATESITAWQNLFGSPPLTFGPDRRLGSRAFVLTEITNGKFRRISGTLGE
jgi:ABC-type branched-subunit amino acid transport system substrate-binding protein